MRTLQYCNACGDCIQYGSRTDDHCWIVGILLTECADCLMCMRRGKGKLDAGDTSLDAGFGDVDGVLGILSAYNGNDTLCFDGGEDSFFVHIICPPAAEKLQAAVKLEVLRYRRQS